MSRVVRISEETFARLQQMAKPLEDTPNSTIERALDELEIARSLFNMWPSEAAKEASQEE